MQGQISAVKSRREESSLSSSDVKDDDVFIGDEDVAVFCRGIRIKRG